MDVPPISEILTAGLLGCCPSDEWVPYEENCYFLHATRYESSLSWGSAAAQCAVLGGALASIHSHAENQFLHSLIEGVAGARDDVWIGMLRRGQGTICTQYLLRYGTMHNALTKHICLVHHVTLLSS